MRKISPHTAVLVALPLFWIVAFNLAPMLSMLRISFMAAFPPAPGTSVVWSVEQYQLLACTRTYLVPLYRTLVLSLSAAALLALVCFPLAYFLARRVPPHKRMFYLVVLLAPFWAGEVLRIFAIVITLGNKGLINSILLNLGILERPVRLLYGYFSLSAGIIHLSALYMFMPVYAALEKIPQNQLDAARDLGAGPLVRLFTVTLPQVRDGIATGAALVFLTNVGSYSVPSMLGGPDTGMFSETIASFFHSASSRWATGAAASVVLLVVSAAIAGSLMLVIRGRSKGALR